MLMVGLIILFPSIVTFGLDRPEHSSQSAPVQILAPQDDSNGSRPEAPQEDDISNLFKQIAPKPPQ